MPTTAMSVDLRIASATRAWRGGRRRTAALPALAIRQDLPAAELRRLARREPDRRAAMRLLAIANALDGFSRAEAARLAGMERQALRDAVPRYNADGMGSLRDQGVDGQFGERREVLRAQVRCPVPAAKPGRGRPTAGKGYLFGSAAA